MHVNVLFNLLCTIKCLWKVILDQFRDAAYCNNGLNHHRSNWTVFYCTGLSGLCVVTHDRFLSPFIENSLILFHNWIVDTYRPGVEVHRWKLNLSHSVHELWKQYLSEHTSALCMYGASDWIFWSTYNSQRTLLHSTTFYLYPWQLCVCVCVCVCACCSTSTSWVH